MSVENLMDVGPLLLGQRHSNRVSLQIDQFVFRQFRQIDRQGLAWRPVTGQVLGKGEGAPVAAAHQTKLTGAPRVPTLNTMDVHFPPRLEKKLNDLAAKTGRAREQLLEDALAGYEASTMATLNWSQCAAVERVPGKVSGAWALRGTRMPVATIFENLEAGANIDDILEWYEGLDREQVKAVIDFAARSVDTPALDR
jgi:uncharacterized protein (DUF433 family)